MTYLSFYNKPLPVSENGGPARVTRNEGSAEAQVPRNREPVWISGPRFSEA